MKRQTQPKHIMQKRNEMKKCKCIRFSWEDVSDRILLLLFFFYLSNTPVRGLIYKAMKEIKQRSVNEPVRVSVFSEILVRLPIRGAQKPTDSADVYPFCRKQIPVT
jgi:hypothetical protein